MTIPALPHEPLVYEVALLTWLGIAVAVFPLLMVIPAPYGRFARSGWGPRVGSKLSWAVMESPAVILAVVLFVVGRHRSTVHVVFLGIWLVHYAHRVFIFPLRLRSGQGVPLAIMVSGFGFHAVNTYLQGRYLFTLGPYYPAAWLADPRFVAGAALFAAGFVINVQSDNLLRSLRGPGETAYRIPRGGLFRWVSCPNYLGEMVEWIAWALLTWSAAGAVFAVWTTANLLPRALSNHKWYRREFADYPPARKAVIPGVL